MKDTSVIMEKLSPKQRELLLLKINKANKEKAEKDNNYQSRVKIPPLRKVADKEKIPLSYSQERQWILEELNPGSGAYNMPSAIRIEGAFDVDKFRQACDLMIARQDSLRTLFQSDGGKPFQTIQDEIDFEVPVIDLTELSRSKQRGRIEEILKIESKTPFRIDRGNLLKITIIKLDVEEFIISLVMHHIISDGWSMEVLISEISKVYDALSKGNTPALPDLPIQYSDYAIWQKSWLKDDVLKEHLEFWEQNLSNAPVLELPTDFPRPSIPTYRGAKIPIHFDKEKTIELKELARQEGITLFMLLLGVWQSLLSIYSNQDDISVGSFIANRNREETENLIGFFINNLTFRTKLNSNLTYRELFKIVRDNALDAFLHQDIPFELVLEKVSPERDASRTRLFQTMLVLQNMPGGEVGLSELKLSPVKEAEIGRSNFDLTLWMWEDFERLGGELEYSLDIFKEDTAQRIVKHFKQIIDVILKDPNTKISEINLLSDSEKDKILLDWNSKELEETYERPIHKFIEDNAELLPEKIAVKFRDQQITYEQLNIKANQIAHFLIENGIAQESRVAISMDRSIDMVVAVLAVLKAGASYIPLDPNYPQERLLYIMQDSNAEFLLTQTAQVQRISDAQIEAISEESQNIQILVLDLQTDLIDEQPIQNPDVEVDPQNSAYIIYTSGSTRQPKGVVINHQSLISAFNSWQQTYDLKGNIENYLQMASFSFDVFIGDFTRALGLGGKLVICPEEIYLQPKELYEYIESEAVEYIEIVPAVLRVLTKYLAENKKKFTTLKYLISGADIIYGKDFAEIESVCEKDVKILNTYGLTEATVDSTFYQAGDSDVRPTQIVSIGKPFPNTKAYILNKSLNPVSIGIPGELFISGESLARCYLNNPELTAERFIPNPFGQIKGDRLYRTGDRAKFDQNGNIDFLGRLDYQVKIRGFRIEVEEIESIITENENVSATVVIAIGKAGTDKTLVAYYIPKEGRDVDVNDLKQSIRDSLPAYMTPSAFVPLEKFPLNPNNKIDRKALPEPSEENFVIEDNYEPPSTEFEEILVSIFEEVLGRQKIGVLDNFFDIGGHSLLATQVVSRINGRFEIEFPLREIFITPNIAEIALTIEEIMLSELEDIDETEFIEPELDESSF